MLSLSEKLSKSKSSSQLLPKRAFATSWYAKKCECLPVFVEVGVPDNKAVRPVQQGVWYVYAREIERQWNVAET